MTKFRQFSFWRSLYLSFYSKELYRDVVDNWEGIGFLHLLGCLFSSLLMLAAIVWAYLAIAVTLSNVFNLDISLALGYSFLIMFFVHKFLIFFLICTTCLALIGGLSKTGLSIKQLLRLASAAATPATILSMPFTIFWIALPYGASNKNQIDYSYNDLRLIAIGFMCIYFIYAIRACRAQRSNGNS